MRKFILISILTLLISGCGWKLPDGMKIPVGNKGSATQSEKEKSKVTGAISGEVTLPSVPFLDSEGKAQPDLIIKADGADVKLPAGTTGKLQITTNSSQTLDSFTEILSSWKINSAPVQLFAFGGIMVAVGVGLIIFGMTRIGVVCIGAGFALIACGVVINQYPWVFLIVVLLALCIGVYFIYNQYKKKVVTGESVDRMYVLESIVDLVAKLPDELQEKYFKQPLREDDKSAMVRSITRSARGLGK